MELFDTHFHFDGGESFESFIRRSYDDLSLAAADFRQKPDKLLMLCAGGNYNGSLRAMEFSGVAEEVYFSCGVHPHDAADYLQSREDFSIFKGTEKLLAVGEIGLDYFYDYSDRDSQKQVLQEFLDLALSWGLPAMLHLRDKDNCFDVYEDALSMLRVFSASGGRFVIHCYAGNSDYADEFLALGGFFGVTGMYTFKAADNIRQTINRLPLERLLIETDSPYLAPVPYRGRSNTPGMTALVAAALGASCGMTPEKAVEFFSGNGKRFYSLGGADAV